MDRGRGLRRAGPAVGVGGGRGGSPHRVKEGQGGPEVRRRAMGGGAGAGGRKAGRSGYPALPRTREGCLLLSPGRGTPAGARLKVIIGASARKERPLGTRENSFNQRSVQTHLRPAVMVENKDTALVAMETWEGGLG